MNRKDKLKAICADVKRFSDSEIEIVEDIVNSLIKPMEFKRDPASALFTEEIIAEIGNLLKIHHAISKESFTKDRFEYALEKVFNKYGVEAELADKGNPGHDISISGIKCSLKTQANRGIKEDEIHISKFMEMGKGDWTDKDSDLIGLRDRFFHHMEQYEKIFVLRALLLDSEKRYELVEIPKSLLLEARDGKLEMMHRSKQMPKPGYCKVFNEKDELKYELYFDGGSERKLRIQKLDKQYCIVHASWILKG